MIKIVRVFLVAMLIVLSMLNVALAELGELRLLPQEIAELQAQLTELPLEQTGSLEAANIELSIATQYQALGDHQAASAGFARVLANQKVRIGLYHPDLVPTYILLLDSALNQRDLNRAAGVISDMEWLATQGSENDPIMHLQLLKSLAFWHLSAFNESIDGASIDHLLDSREYLNQAIEYGRDPLLYDPELRLAELLSAWQLELIVNSIADGVGYNRGGSRPVSLSAANIELVEELCQRNLPQVPVTSIFDENGELVFSSPDGGPDTPILDMDQMRPYFSGCNKTFSDERERQSALLDAQLDSATPDRWLQMGDWYLMTGEVSKAEEWYLRVWEAADLLPSELLARIAKPEPLTLSNLLSQTLEIRRGYRDTRTVRYLLDIDADGQLADASLHEGYINPLSEDEYNAVTGWISSLQFRPPLGSEELEDRSDDLCHFSLAQKQCLSD